MKNSSIVLTSVRMAAALLALAVLQAIAAQPTAATQSEPPWPREFSAGPEPATLGFAVTRPGPIRISVEWNGPPLAIELLGPHPMQVSGQGRSVLDYAVTPDDVRRGLFWQVKLTPQAPAVARGVVSLQRPPVNAAVVAKAVQAYEAQRPTGAASAQPDGQFAQAFSSALNERLTRIDQEQVARRANAQRQFDAFNARLAEAPPGAVTSRAVPNGMSSAERIGGVVLAKPVPTDVYAAAPSAPMEPATTASATQVYVPPVTVVAPVLSQVTPGEGQPGGQVALSGSGFGTGGEVHFILSRGAYSPVDVVAPLDGPWSDTQLKVRVPSAPKTVPGPAQVYVVNGGGTTAKSTFAFTPVLATRTYYMQVFTPGARITTPGTAIPVGTWPGYDGSKHPSGGVEHENWDLFVGHRDSDEFLRGVVLRNGWTLKDVLFATYYGHNAGANLEGFNAGSNTPIVTIHWWANGAFPFVTTSVAYTMAAIIQGPADMEDGWLCPTLPCK